MRYAGGLVCVVALLASVSSARANDDLSRPYTFEEVLTEDQVWNMGGKPRLLSSQRILTGKGCFDLSTDPPVQLDELHVDNKFGLRYGSGGGTVFRSVEGAAHLLVQSRDYDRDRRQWTVTIARVGCVVPQILHRRTFTDEEEPRDLRIADLYPSVSRPLNLYDPDGLSRLDLSATEELEPTLWLSGERLWQGILDAHGGEVPAEVIEGGELEEVHFTSAELHPLDEDTFIAQLGFSVSYVGVERRSSFVWTVKLEEDGALEVIMTPQEYGGDQALYLVPDHDAFFLGGVTYPLEDLPIEELRARSFPMDQRYKGMLLSGYFNQGERATLEAEGRYVIGHRVLTTHPELADFDRDGVSTARERELGSSDVNPDSDGDGISDGAELFAGRSVLVAEPYEAGESFASLGRSNMIMEWAPMSLVRVAEGNLRRDLLSRFFHPFSPSARVLCSFPIGAARVGWDGVCYDHELEEIGNVSFDKKPLFTSDSQAIIGGTKRVDILTGEETPDVIDLQGRSLLGANAKGGLVFAPTGTLLDRSEVFYQPEPGAQHEVLAVTGSPVDLERVTWVTYLGYSLDGVTDFFSVDAFLGGVPVGNSNYSEKWLYGMRDGKISGLFEMRTLLLKAGLDPNLAEDYTFGQVMGVDEPGGYLIRLDKINTNQAIFVIADERFAPRRIETMPRMLIGAWWREGFMSATSYKHRVAIAANGSPDSTCVSLDGVIACDAEPGMIYMATGEIEETIYQQIVPMTLGLGTDDVILSAHQDGIWRYTPEGAVARWISTEKLEQMRLDARIEAPVHSNISRLALRRDRRALCAIAQDELYVIELDERGVASSMRHVDVASGVASACGWSASGNDVVWADASGKVSREGNPLFDVGEQIHTLLSVQDGRWVSASTLGTLRCHAPDGEVSGIVENINGATLFDEQLLYVNSGSAGPSLLSVEELCVGQNVIASPLTTLYGGFLWEEFYRKVQGSILPSHRVYVRQSDVAVVAKDQVLMVSRETDGTAFVGTVAPVPMRIRPAYPDLSEETAALVGEKPYHTGMVFRGAELNVLAMASAPNANLARSTSYYQEPALPDAPAPQDPDMQPDEAGEEPEEPGGCAGCHTAPGQGSAPLWLLGLLLLARRRKRRQ